MSDESAVACRIKAFNEGRDPATLALKYAAMRADPFGFYRGTCHLFYEDWPRRGELDDAPISWVSGDLHPENFGSYRARDGEVYFDVNDFDEAAFGPLTWDVVRCLTGTLVGASVLGVLPDDAEPLCRRYLYAYCAALGTGRAGVLDPSDAAGMVKDLLVGVEARSPGELVRHRTEKRKKGRRLIVDGVHTLAADPEEASRVVKRFDEWRKRRKRTKGYAVLDVARRAAGTGSLGLARFVLLVELRNGLHLLDVKEEPKSAAATFGGRRQPRFPNEAARVVAAQKRAQAVAPAPLDDMADGARSFVIKELEPTEDRVRWERWHGKLERLERLLATMGAVTAWSHVRAAQAAGVAIARVRAFGARRDWPGHAMEYARQYAQRVQRDHADFAAAYDRRYFRTGAHRG